MAYPGMRSSMLKLRRSPGCDGDTGRGAPEDVSFELRQVSQAQLLLDSLGHVRSPAGEAGPLHAKEVGGAGCCFFMAFADQLGPGVAGGFRLLAVFALVQVAKRRADFVASVPSSVWDFSEPLEVQAGRRALATAWRGYSAVALTMEPFDVRVLDKFEGVPREALRDARRYAEQQEMIALLQSCSLELLVVEGADAPGTSARTKLYPSGGDLDAALPKLRRGVLDLVFVRYGVGAWQHYQSVCFTDGRSWRLSEGARCRVEALVAGCPVCGALVHGNVDLARGLMLSMLGLVGSDVL